MKQFYLSLFLALVIFTRAQVPPVCFNTFIPASVTSVGTYPLHVCTADFNLDGKPDVAVANQSSGNISLLLGTGSGGFSPAVNITTGVSGWGICTADFNGDGFADLALTGTGTTNSLSILMGTGTGAFGAQVNYAAGTSAYGVQPADFNADGNIDLAVICSANLSIYLGSPTGTFSLLGNYSAGSNPISLCVSDFNNDGKADVAVTNNITAGNVGVFMGLGTGAFTTVVNYAVGASPYDISFSDYDSDGNKDLTVCNYSSGNVSILMGSSSGTFAAAVNYSTGVSSDSGVSADFNADGKPDLAVADANDKRVCIMLGSGSGSFTSSINYILQDAPYALVPIDLNGDGAVDLAASCNNANRVAVMLGNGTGGLSSAIGCSVGTVPYCARSADFNADGMLDLVVANYGSASVSVLLGQGNGNFSTAVNYSVGNEPWSVATADFNGDGKTDIVSSNFISGNVSVLLGSTTGTFAAAVNFTVGFNPTAVIATDLNNDGAVDLAVTKQSGNVCILMGTGTGNFGPVITYSANAAPYNLAKSDFNGDGYIDLAVTNYASTDVSILLGSLTGTFSPPVNFGVSSNPDCISIADFNGDLKSDIAVGNSGVALVSVLLGTGTGSFLPQAQFNVNATPNAISTGDYNGDGNPDIVTASYVSNGNISVLLGTGSGSFLPQVNFTVGANPRSIESADFNSDGKTDLAVANAFASNVYILLNGSPTVSLSTTNTVCLGNSMTITAYGANTYTWSTGSTANPLVFNPTSNGTYSVIAKSFGGCAGTAVKTITVNTLPLPTITVNSGTVCVGKSFTIAPTGADIYSITGGAAIVTPSVTKTYSVVGTSTLTGCRSGVALSSVTVYALPTISVSSGTICAGQNYSIMPSGAVSYTYQGGSGVVNPTQSSSYSVVGTSSLGCISHSVVANVGVFPLPVIAVNSGAICAGKSFTMIPAGAPSFSYPAGSAVFTPVVTSSYVVIGISSVGCQASVVSHVTVNPLPTITISGNNSVCNGSQLSLIVSGTALSYSWSNGMTGNLVTLSPTISTNYTITATNANCTNSVTRFITVNTLPTITINNGSVCSGQAFTLTPSGAQYYSYPGNSAVVSPVSNTVYLVVGTDANNCVGSASSTVTVKPLPIVTIAVVNLTLCAGEANTLTAAGASSYSWSSGPAINPLIITPVNTTTYTVTGTDSDGCFSTEIFIQNVDACLSVPQLPGFASQLAVYPNPTKGNFSIESDVVLLLSITNAIGQPVSDMELIAGKNKIDLSNYNNGVYFLHFKNGNATKVIKLIKD